MYLLACVSANVHMYAWRVCSHVWNLCMRMCTFIFINYSLHIMLEDQLLHAWMNASEL